MAESTPKAVYAAIKHVMEDMAKTGVGKDRTNTQQNFKYRAIDDVMDALSPSLSRHGLLIVPHVNERVCTERQSRAGGTLFHTLLRIDYDFICVSDGSQHLVGPIYGEAMDSGDKSTNKAMAAAYKYACTQTFCIPISGDDPDAQSHEVVSNDAPVAARRPRRQEATDAPRSVQTPPSAPALPSAALGPASVPDKPLRPRPGGDFSYGKKFRDTPINVMTTSDLEWFLNADRTPQDVRHRIVDELQWREYEAARSKKVQTPMQDVALDEDIP